MGCTQTGDVISCDMPLLSGAPIYYGTDELAHIMQICDAHREPTTFLTDRFADASYAATYETAWKACYRVHEAWMKSEAHRKLVEAQAQAERDRQQVEEFVRKLDQEDALKKP